jgi:hypothetical protein
MAGSGRGRRVATLGLVAVMAAGCTSFLPKAGSGPPMISPLGAFAMRSAPVTGEAARFSFAAVSGAPTDVLRDMSGAMNRESSARKLVVVPAGDPTATYVVKGYLSAVGDAGGTSLVFVWDVFDQRGVRLHRVSGQVAGGRASTDPWTGIKDNTIDAAARRTVDSLAHWAKA